jgi:hypothetical protein
VRNKALLIAQGFN